MHIHPLCPICPLSHPPNWKCLAASKALDSSSKSYEARNYSPMGTKPNSWMELFFFSMYIWNVISGNRITWYKITVVKVIAGKATFFSSRSSGAKIFGQLCHWDHTDSFRLDLFQWFWGLSQLVHCTVLWQILPSSIHNLQWEKRQKSNKESTRPRNQVQHRIRNGVCCAADKVQQCLLTV